MDIYLKFWSRVAIGQPNECWPWLRGTDSDGYGHFWCDGRQVKAHRFAYEATGVKIANQIDHLCRTRLCCNPAHLEDVTIRVNVLRGASHVAGNARKTHCKRGHAFTEDNTYVYPRGGRSCRACMRMHDLNFKLRQQGKTARPL